MLQAAWSFHMKRRAKQALNYPHLHVISTTDIILLPFNYIFKISLLSLDAVVYIH
jgi:hypothetical protein